MGNIANILKRIGLFVFVFGLFIDDRVLEEFLQSFPKPFGLTYSTALTIIGAIMLLSGFFYDWWLKRQGD